MKIAVIGPMVLALSTPAFGQVATPIPAVAVDPGQAVLPRNTQVVLTLNETLNTKSKRTRKGETFALSVARNVILNGYVVIPRGSRGSGTVTWRTKKGGFGKSGKMEISLDYVEIGDQRIPLEGRHREEGDGNSAATITTALFLSLVGSGFITGHSAEIPQGREFIAWTKEDTPVSFVGLKPVRALTATATLMQEDAAGRRRNPNYLGPHVVCETCRQ